MCRNCHHFQVEPERYFLTLAGFLNVSGNGVGDELVHDVLQIGGGHLPADDVNHLLPDVPHLIVQLLRNTLVDFSFDL